MGTPPISFHDTGGECDTLGLLLSQFFYPLCLLTPPSYGHSPYILCCATRNVAGHGRVRSETSLFYCCFGFSVTTYRLSYILLRATGEEGVNAL